MVPLWLTIVSVVAILALAFCVDSYVDFHNDRVRMDKLLEGLDK